MAGEDWQKYLPAEPAAPPAAAGGDDWMKYIPEKTSGTKSFLRGAAQELSFGFADEIAGGVESLFSKKKYKQARDESRANYATAEADNPELYTAGQVTGGLASLAIPGGAIGKAVGTGAKVGRAAGAGAVYGAGHSTAETAGGVLKDTAIGAGLGAGVYGAGRVLGAAGKKVVDIAPDLLKNAMANRIMGAAGGMITGAVGGGGITGSIVGAGLGMMAPSAGKLIKNVFGGKAARGAIKPPGASASLLAPPASSPIKDFAPPPAPPVPVVAAPAPIPVSAPVAKPRSAPPLLPRDAGGRFLPANAPARKIAHPAPSQDAFKGKVQEGYEAGFAKQSGRPKVVPDDAPVSGKGMDDLKGQIQGNKAGGIPKEDQSTVDALRNVISSRSREGNIPGLKHYPQSPTKAFQGYLDELPKSDGGTPKGQKDALVKLVLGFKHSGGDPGELVYRARAAGVPDKAIMRAVGFGPQGGGVAVKAPKAPPPAAAPAAAEKGTKNIRAPGAEKPVPAPVSMADGPKTMNDRAPGAVAPPVPVRNRTMSLVSPPPVSSQKFGKPWTNEEFLKGIDEADAIWKGKFPVRYDEKGRLMHNTDLEDAILIARMKAEGRGEYPRTDWFGRGNIDTGRK